MASVYFISLGCDKNRIDAEIMMKRLVDGGHTITADINEADVAIVNTCGFIDSAKEQAIECIFDMVREKETGKVRGVVVTGCMAQRYADEVRRLIPEVDGVVGLAYNADICRFVADVLAGQVTEEFGAPEGLVIEGERLLSTPQHYAYIKIAEGCSNHCTYCAIPGIRGPFRSRRMADIITEAEWLAKQGVRELILIAQDTTSYGKDLEDGSSLANLLKELCAIETLWKIRILYAYPEKINEELIDVMASQPKIAKYLDIPMQHANEGVLRRMGRFGDKGALLALIEKLRSAMPDITLRSTFIVGFPGETEQQFQELLSFLQTAKLDRAGCFAYSAEDGTPAAKLDGQLNEEEKQRRVQEFMAVQDAVLARKQQDMVGKTMEVICDGFDEEIGAFCCRGEADAPDIDACVWMPPDCDLVPGEIYSVEVNGLDGIDLIADLK